jgi:diguanylate cyclase (GGDEF)-like protein
LRFHIPEQLLHWRPKKGSRAWLTLLVVIIVLLTGMIHFVTGPSLELSVFYLIPVGFAAWYLGAGIGYFVALSAVADWIVVDLAFGPHGPQPWDEVFNAAARLVVFLVMVVFIQRRRIALDRANQLARSDPLTQLLNAQSLRELGGLELERARRYQHSLTAMFIDLDGFKSINDSLGHQGGDAVLQEFARAISANIRSTDLAARVGGDEFLILMPETGPEAVTAIASKLRRQLLDAMHAGGWPVTFSLGVATFLVPPTTLDELVNKADALMYRVKQRGKNALEHEVVSSG